VGSDDAKAGELAMKMLDFARSSGFQIEHQRRGAIAGKGGAYLFVGTRQVNKFKMLGETDCQSLSSPRVFLIQDYTEWFHTSP
jgi:hypothetical protein